MRNVYFQDEPTFTKGGKLERGYLLQCDGPFITSPNKKTTYRVRRLNFSLVAWAKSDPRFPSPLVAEIACVPAPAPVTPEFVYKKKEKKRGEKGERAYNTKVCI